MKKNAKLELVSSHIDLSVILFFSLKTVANLGRSRKTDLREILPKDVGKEHFLAEEMVTNGDFCPWLAVKSCETEREKSSSMFLVTAKNPLISKHSSKGI